MRINRTTQTDQWKGVVPVEWHISQWHPAVQPEALTDFVAVEPEPAIKPLIPAAFMRHPARRHKLFKLMKKSALTTRPRRAAFTLVELLTVIAIIAVLAAMLVPVLTAVKRHALVVRASTEMQGIVTAINSYDTDYGRFPVTADEQKNNGPGGTNDITVGLVNEPQTGTLPQYGMTTTNTPSFDNNSNVVAILMDVTAFPNGTPTWNANHVKNPKQTKYFTPHQSGYNPATDVGVPQGGVDNNGIYRDPWGTPYIITLDLSYDDHCSDMVYSLAAVSQNPPPPGTYAHQGFNGLSNPDVTATDNFLYNGKVMVWSMGPDRKYDVGTPGAPAPANAGYNKDNVVSW